MGVQPPLPVSAAVIARIRRHRQARKMSAQTLADAITANGYHLQRATLANQEAGRAQTIPIDLIAAAAKVFGLPITALLEDVACGTCGGKPPRGFACITCGAGTPTP
ncbi:helix-turn-helix transcriptional regulator [Streptomyces sp.]|uniref:helix-turn-helix domain-containing protein n=1 Tax=Streptomyces sp. TaxID=1931 RepID=UPI002D783033|nr:helix-turn-helix transcriptional regulator [Streptomyces sp.]HET6355998.1 helix-turn-helix transcriptional regulator [Streptomyces sp.]